MSRNDTREVLRALRTNTENLCGARAFCNIDICDVEFSRVIRIAPDARRRVVVERVLRAPTLPRQHFLKRDAVFSNVLVYSGCSAYRFPNARSD
jgi:hypothetical protein